MHVDRLTQEDVGGLSYSCPICTCNSVCGTWLNPFCIHDLCKHKYTNLHSQNTQKRKSVCRLMQRQASTHTSTHLACFYEEKKPLHLCFHSDVSLHVGK